MGGEELKYLTLYVFQYQAPFLAGYWVRGKHQLCARSGGVASNSLGVVWLHPQIGGRAGGADRLAHT